MRILKLSSAIFTAAMLAFAGVATAQDAYPSKSIRMLVPWAPGNFTDILSRKLSDELSKALGQSVWVENKGGAGGMVGTELLSKADPDGYTIGIGAIGPLAMNPALYKGKLQYDPIEGFTPISMLWTGPMVVLVRSASPYKSLQELIEASKLSASGLTMATPGNGTLQHITAEYLNSESKAKFEHIPHQGSNQAQVSLLGGHVDAMVDNLSVALSHIKSGSVRALAVSTADRSPLVPDVPTIAESGFPDVITTGWICLVGPKGMPIEMRTKISQEVHEILQRPEFKKWVSDQGGQVTTSTPEELEKFIGSEVARLGKIINDLHIQF